MDKKGISEVGNYQLPKEKGRKDFGKFQKKLSKIKTY
jgi:hypothetical protein